jgi:hypothetical protein
MGKARGQKKNKFSSRRTRKTPPSAIRLGLSLLVFAAALFLAFGTAPRGILETKGRISPSSALFSPFFYLLGHAVFALPVSVLIISAGLLWNANGLARTRLVLRCACSVLLYASLLTGVERLLGETGRGGGASGLWPNRSPRGIAQEGGTRLYLGSANLTGAGMGSKQRHARNFEFGFYTIDRKLIARTSRVCGEIWLMNHCASCRAKRLYAFEHARIKEALDQLGIVMASWPIPPFVRSADPGPDQAIVVRR